MRKAKLTTAALFAGVLVLLAPGPRPAAATIPTVGIGDNAPEMFADANYKKLDLPIARKIVAYDFFRHPTQRFEFDRWVRAAELAEVRPLIALNHSDLNPTRLPSVGAYRKTILYLRKHYPELTELSVWNEANHRTQPTSKYPRRAAQYFNAAQRLCKSCTIVAADVLDQKDMIPWITVFKRYARSPKLWGLHSYTDANRNRSWRDSTSRKLLAAIDGEVWLTEVGGIVAMRDVYRYNESRAARGLKNTLRMARQDRRITRAYLYSWYGTKQPRKLRFYAWDSGLVSWNGANERRGLTVLRRWLKKYPAATKAP